ncbi:HTH domain-containing protein [Candidatus Peregrinibacteria bacterium]|nr:HTH domain-containing protein [Candidatus Peregrinibacteria bacterium]
MQIEQFLKQLELGDKETKVYLQLMQTGGPQPASSIARKLSMNRTTVYKVLLRLSKLGLVGKTMNHGIQCFIVEEPDKRIQVLLEKRRKNLDEIEEKLQDILPIIQNLSKSDTMIMPAVKYYEGVEGVKHVYKDSLKEGETIYAFENVEHMVPEIKDYIFNDYIPKRTENDIFIQVISPENKDHIAARKNDKKFCRETRFFTKVIIPIDIEINIYGNKTAFFSYKKEEMFAIIIESRSVANSMRSIHQFCWNIAK